MVTASFSQNLIGLVSGFAQSSSTLFGYDCRHEVAGQYLLGGSFDPKMAFYRTCSFELHVASPLACSSGMSKMSAIDSSQGSKLSNGIAACGCG